MIEPERREDARGFFARSWCAREAEARGLQPPRREIVDLRRGSPTLTRHVAVVLSRENQKMLYVTEGVAHGFQTFEDDTEVFYQMSEFYSPAHARGGQLIM